MVQILKELRIDSKIVTFFTLTLFIFFYLDFIVRIYREDSTKIQLEKNKEIEIEVTSGIRQGCTASTVLFKLITYKIIEEMRKTEGIQILGPKITCLFYADDEKMKKNEKCLFSNTQEFYIMDFNFKHTGVLHGLNRHQRFIHSVGGFKKPIYRYTNQANIS